jgi:hypothetical protein
MYVITRRGELVFGTRPHDVRRPHPTLVGEVDPEVLGGGTIDMRNGRIYEVRADSGHHRPTSAGTEAMILAFSRLPRSVFHPDFRGFVPHGEPPIVPEFIVPRWRQRLRAIQNRADRMKNHLSERAKGYARLLANHSIIERNGTNDANSKLNAIIAGQARLIREAEQFGPEIASFLTREYRSINQHEADAMICAGQTLMRQIFNEIEVEASDELPDSWQRMEWNQRLINRIVTFLKKFVEISP